MLVTGDVASVRLGGYLMDRGYGVQAIWKLLVPGRKRYEQPFSNCDLIIKLDFRSSIYSNRTIFVVHAYIVDRGLGLRTTLLLHLHPPLLAIVVWTSSLAPTSKSVIPGL